MLTNFADGDEQPQFTFPPDEFTSKKITTKILQQIEVIAWVTFDEPSFVCFLSSLPDYPHSSAVLLHIVFGVHS